MSKIIGPRKYIKSANDRHTQGWNDAIDRVCQDHDMLDHDDLCRLSRAFNQVADLANPQDFRINEALKRRIAAEVSSHPGTHGAKPPSEENDGPSLNRRSEADAYYKILQTIARFPITDPKNQDAVNMKLIAEGALTLSPRAHGARPMESGK